MTTRQIRGRENLDGSPIATVQRYAGVPFFCAGGDQGLDYWILSKMRVFLFDPPPFVLDLF
jgi:hypothetical protein